MSKILSKLSILGAGLLFVYGCASAKTPALEFKNYIQDRERVDREVQGAVGNWDNAPEAEPPGGKATRRMYVFEVTQDVELTPEEKFVMEEDYVPSPSTYKEPLNQSNQNRRISLPQEIDIPPIDDIVIEDNFVPGNVGTGQGRYQEYTVEKNDTLQKISKKFYDSYSKWPRIYEANKNVIKSPDSIKPGTVLRIPVD